MPQLTILTVTRAEQYSKTFLYRFMLMARAIGAECMIALDGPGANGRLQAMKILNPSIEEYHVDFVRVDSAGFIESVLDQAVDACHGRYVLRLDDDEAPSLAMFDWLLNRQYLDQPHWCFPRGHRYNAGLLMTPHLWPDVQTRLSLKEMSGGRHTLHAPSPFGAGTEAPVMIHHHKFMARTRKEREETSRRWHSGNMLAFSLPEDVYQTARLVEAGTGEVPWTPAWEGEVKF